MMGAGPDVVLRSWSDGPMGAGRNPLTGTGMRGGVGAFWIARVGRGAWVSRVLRGAWMSICVLCAVGCREATAPFASDDRPVVQVEGPLQLTYSAFDERTPVWVGDGDSLAYVAEGFAPFAEGPGVLMKISAAGGPAEALLPALQFPGGASHWLASPALSADGTRVAYMEMWLVADEELCPATTVVCDPGGTSPVASRLGEIRLHLMPREGGGSPAPDGTLVVPLDGREFVPTPGDPFLPGFFRIHYYPFQRLFHEENPPLFRPSWDPGGGRIAFSDGLQLLLWDLQSARATAIPGTADGVSPAWSPDGGWIAFTRLVRGDSVEAACTHSGFLGPVCRQERVEFSVRRREIVLVRPDGSRIRELGRGEEPVWTPDSGRVVFRRAGSLWTVPVGGGQATPIPGTEGAREPAVSPDGNSLAYVRSLRGGKHDLWVVPFGGGGS